MRRDLVVMPAEGISLAELSEIVQSTDYQGYPVVRSQTDRTIKGFIRKNDLRYALDRARRNYTLSPNTLCTFSEYVDAQGDDSGLLPHPDIVVPSGAYHGAEVNHVDFGQYVDEIPLNVPPKMPLEIVLQLFRRMGPRVVLVNHEGQLAGMVTIKDLLRHEASEKAAEEVAAANAAAEGHSRTGSWSEWSPIPDSRGGQLEGLLEDGLVWAQTRGVGVVNEVIARVRSARPGGGVQMGQGRSDHAYSFEMNEDGRRSG